MALFHRVKLRIHISLATEPWIKYTFFMSNLVSFMIKLQYKNVTLVCTFDVTQGTIYVILSVFLSLNGTLNHRALRPFKIYHVVQE